MCDTGRSVNVSFSSICDRSERCEEGNADGKCVQKLHDDGDEDLILGAFESLWRSNYFPDREVRSVLRLVNHDIQNLSCMSLIGVPYETVSDHLNIPLLLSLQYMAILIERPRRAAGTLLIPIVNFTARRTGPPEICLCASINTILDRYANSM